MFPLNRYPSHNCYYHSRSPFDSLYCLLVRDIESCYRIEGSKGFIISAKGFNEEWPRKFPRSMDIFLVRNVQMYFFIRTIKRNFRHYLYGLEKYRWVKGV